MLSHDSAPIVAFEVQPEAARMPVIAQAPRLSQASVDAVREVMIVDENGSRRPVHIPAERALTVRIDGSEFVTLMTLGGAPELMVIGFLLNQRIIESAAFIESIMVDWDAGTAAVVTWQPRMVRQPEITARAVAMGSGQGSVFVDFMSQIDAVRLSPAKITRIDRATLLAILETMRQHDAIHRTAGSVHSCGLFQGEKLLICVEDVGRHNGLDTISGWMALHGAVGGDKVLFTTGRFTGEMVMKMARSGIPIGVSRNGVSAMGYDLASRLGMTLIGRAQKGRFICYTGLERFDAPGV
jgi:FdhD protein